MSQVHGLACNTLCGAALHWVTERGEKAPTKAVMEARARKQGWHAPDKLGRHLCPKCCRPDGRRKR